MASAIGGGGGKAGGFDFPAAPDIQQLIGQQVDLSRGVARENQFLANANFDGPFGTQTASFNPDTGQATITNEPLPGISDLIARQIDQRSNISTLSERLLGNVDQDILGGFDLSDIDETVGIKGGLPDIQTQFNQGLGLGRLDINDIRFAPELLDAINLAGINPLPTAPGEFDPIAEQAQADVLRGLRAGIDPQQQDAAEALRQSLANRGLPVGGEAQRAALRNQADRFATTDLRLAGQATQFGEQFRRGRFADILNLNQTDFLQRLEGGRFTNASRLAGAQNLISLEQINDARAINEAGFSNTARSQAIREALLERNQAFNEIGALSGLSSGFLPTPQQQGFNPVTFSAPDLLGSFLAQQNIASNQAIAQGQANQQAKGSGIGGLAQLGSAGIGAAFPGPASSFSLFG